MIATFVACNPQVLEHEHNYVESNRKEPTCTEDGFIEYECIVSECGQPVKKEKLSATDHDYIEIERVEPLGCGGCAGNGSVTYKCNNCNDEYFDYIYGPGHDSYMIEHFEPTCTSDAQDLYGCRNCEDT